MGFFTDGTVSRGSPLQRRLSPPQQRCRGYSYHCGGPRQAGRRIDPSNQRVGIEYRCHRVSPGSAHRLCARRHLAKWRRDLRDHAQCRVGSNHHRSRCSTGRHGWIGDHLWLSIPAVIIQPIRSGSPSRHTARRRLAHFRRQSPRTS